MTVAELCLRLQPEAKCGVLECNGLSREVTVLHLRANGDALVHDGARIMMVPRRCVLEDGDEPRAGKLAYDCDGRKRLVFVKTMYEKLLAGQLDLHAVRSEGKRYGLFA